MQTTDVRNLSWEQIQARIFGDRQAVYEALVRSQKALTARQLAEELGRDLLCVAPRLTELCQLGLARLAGRQGRRGCYAGVPMDLAAERHARREKPEQMALL
jgi:predicted transcriptional regulator